MTLQNGGGNLEILQNIFGKNHVLYGLTSFGAYIKEPGEICHAGMGLLDILSPTNVFIHNSIFYYLLLFICLFICIGIII